MCYVEKGTVIRVHSTTDGSRLFELRRGIQRYVFYVCLCQSLHMYNCFRDATIYSLAFSPDSIFLAASSNTGTIHIFRLIDPTTK